MATSLLLFSSLSMLFLTLTFDGLPPLQQQQVHKHAPASTPASPSRDTQRGPAGSRASGGGLNVLAAILVIASSIMVFMALKYTGCGRSSSGSSTASESQNGSLSEEDVEAAAGIMGSSAVHNNSNSSNGVSGGIAATRPSGAAGVAPESKKKKPSNKLIVESIDKFTVLADYESLTRTHRVVPVVGGLSCSVCLCEFMSESEIRLLPSCRHFFHPDCIDVWLVSNMTCPVCRRSVVPSVTGEVGSSTGE